MMRILFLLLGLSAAGCMTGAEKAGGSRPFVLRDVEGYAIACCLARQTEPYLKDQGDAWASGIVQRSHGDMERFKGVCEQVEHETAKGDMFVILTDRKAESAVKTVPLAYCAEIIDTPSVRDAIQKAVEALVPNYEFARKQAEDEPSLGAWERHE